MLQLSLAPIQQSESLIPVGPSLPFGSAIRKPLLLRAWASTEAEMPSMASLFELTGLRGRSILSGLERGEMNLRLGTILRILPTL